MKQLCCWLALSTAILLTSCTYTCVQSDLFGNLYRVEVGMRRSFDLRVSGKGYSLVLANYTSRPDDETVEAAVRGALQAVFGGTTTASGGVDVSGIKAMVESYLQKLKPANTGAAQ